MQSWELGMVDISGLVERVPKVKGRKVTLTH